MKHTKLKVGLETFLNWLEAKNRIQPLMYKLNDEFWYVVYTFTPAESIMNASIRFEGSCEEKYFFDGEHPGDPKETANQFPPNESLGSIRIIEADKDNIDLYFYIDFSWFCDDIDGLLSETPNSWEIEVFSDPPLFYQTEEKLKSKRDLIIEFYNKGLPYEKISKALKDYDIDIVPKTVRNLVSKYRKELGLDNLQHQIKKTK